MGLGRDHLGTVAPNTKREVGFAHPGGNRHRYYEVVLLYSKTYKNLMQFSIQLLRISL